MCDVMYKNHNELSYMLVFKYLTFCELIFDLEIQKNFDEFKKIAFPFIA